MSEVPKNIITLCGPNAYLLEQRLNQIKSEFVDEFGDLAVEAIDGEEATEDQIRFSLESLPFLSPKKLVIIKRLSSNKTLAENIEDFISNVSDSTDIILVEPKPDKRGIYYKTTKKLTRLEEFVELDELSAGKWLVDEAKKAGGELSISDARYMAERVGLNQQILHTELIKLIDYDSKISRQNIDDLTEASPQGTVFNLLDAAFAGNRRRALELYESQRTQRLEPQAILGMIVWQMHLVALVGSSKKTIDQLAKDTKRSPFVLGKARSISERLGRAELKNLLDRLCALDKRLKSESIDVDEALRQLLFDLAV